jgi:hypothetical protein
MITWKFEELDVYFQSKGENLSRDISKMAYANGVKQNANIIIIDGPITQFMPTDTDSVDGDTSTISQPTVSVDAKKAEATKQETNELPDLFGDVESTSTSDPILEDGIDLELLNGSSDSVAL